MKKQIALSVLGVILLALVLIAVFARRASDHPYYADNLPYPLVIAHQGGDGLWPGDTMFAFEHAAELGVDVLEMDLHITKDGVLVINHDETVDRTTDGAGEIEAMLLDEIKALDAGYDWSNDNGNTFPYRGMGITIPTLAEVFEAFPGYHMTIEIKTTERSMAMPFCEMIRAYDM
jgi:glycerophosphoryl diester phosphodiesterase